MKSSHMIATSFHNIELLPGMQQLSSRDLHLDFDIDGRNSQCAQPLNTDIIKSDLDELYSDSPPASLAKIGNNESPTIARSHQRIKTLQIFKQSMKSEKQFKLQSPQMKQTSHKSLHIKSDSTAAKNLVDKSKQDSSKQKKDKTRGLMYINELWAVKYEKQTIKAANIEKELNPIEARYLEPVVKRKTNLPELNTKSPTLSSPKSTLESLPFISNTASHQRFKSDSDSFPHHLISPKSRKIPPVTERFRQSVNLSEKIDTEHSSPLFSQRPSLPLMMPPFSSSRSPLNSSLGYLPDISPYIQTSTKETEPIAEEDGFSNTSFDNQARRNTKSQSLNINTSPKTFKPKRKILTQINTQFSEEDEDEEGFSILLEKTSPSPRVEQLRLKALSESQKLAVNDIIGKCKSERQDTKKIVQGMQGLSNLFKRSKLDQRTRIDQTRKNDLIESCKNALEARTKAKNFS